MDFDTTTATNNYNYIAFDNEIIKELMYLIIRYDDYLKGIMHEDIFINATYSLATLCTNPLAMNEKYLI